MTVTLTVSDGSLTASDSFTLTVTPLNDGPVANADSTDMSEDGSVTVYVLSNDTDIDLSHEGDTLTIVSNGTVPHGTVTIAGDKKSLTYTPNSNWNGEDTFSYTMRDSAGITASAGVTITVNPVNDAPSAVNDLFTTAEDAALVLDVLDNDLDTDLAHEGDTLTIVSAGSAGHGTLSLAGDKKTLTYTPSSNWNGDDSFTYTMRDAAGSQSSATVNITVTAVNDNPTAVNDTAAVGEDGSVEVSVLTNDSDVDFDVLLNKTVTESWTVTAVSDPPHGTATITGSNLTVTYAPDADWNGSDSFTYTVTDAGGKTATATVNVTVNPLNDGPTISDVPDQTVNEDGNSGAIAFTVGDIDNDPASLTVTATTGNGTVLPLGNIVITAGSGGNRNVTLTPAGNENTWNKLTSLHDPVTVTLTVSDGSLTASDSFTLTVTPLNDGPVANADSTSMSEDGSVTVYVLSNDSDIDLSHEGDTLTIVSNGTVPHGTVMIAGDKKSLTYTPNSNWNGEDTFSYTMRDSAGSTASAGVTITVNPVNDAPSAVNDLFTTAEDAALVLDVLDNDLDTDLAHEGDTLTIVSAGSAGHGTLLLAGDKKTLTYTPSSNWNGDDSFTYTMRDAAGSQSGATVNITVTPVNDDPVAVNDTAAVGEDGSVEVSVLTNDSDVDFDVLLNKTVTESWTVTAVSDPPHGTATITGSNLTATYAPDADWNGSDSFTYTVTDAGGKTATATVTVAVSQAYDRPVPVNDSANTTEGTPVNVNVLSNDNDIDLGLTLNGDVQDHLRVTLVSTPAHGTVVIETDYSLTYTPAQYYNGSDTFTYTVSDDGNLTAIAQVEITVNVAVNDPPTAVDDTASVNEDGQVIIYVLANDTDPDLAYEGDNLIIASVGTVPHGTVTVATDKKSLTYTPDADWNGTDTFSYTMQDKSVVQDSASVSVTVAPINDAPIISDVTDRTISEDADTGAISFTVDDVDNDPGSLAVTAASANGAVVPVANISIVNSGGKNRTVTIMPLANQNTWNKNTSNHDPVTITLTVSDGSLTDADTFTLTVNPVNDAPVAVVDSAVLNEDASIVIDVLNNDTDIDLSREGDVLTILSATGMHHSTVTVATDKKTLTFSPDANWNGIETFTYTMRDSSGTQSSALVTVTVNPLNDAPTISDISDQTTNEDTPTAALAFTVDDVDSSLAGLTVTAVSGNAAVIPLSNIVIAAGSGGSRTVTLTPLANQNTWNKTASAHLPITITLTVSDGSRTASDSFTLTVTPVNDGPTAVKDAAEVDEDENVVINVLANDTDPDLALEGDTLTIFSTSGVENATVAIAADKKSLTFTPSEDWNGEETFTYTIQDKGGLQSSGQVLVTVKAVDDAIGTIRMITPVSGEKHKDGQTVYISWTKPANTDVTNIHYALEFYNGTRWIVIADNVTETSFYHRLDNTQLHTREARYRVRGWNESLWSAYATGAAFVIDNQAPQGVNVTMTSADGLPYTPGDWSSTALDLKITNGSDLVNFHYRLESDNGQSAELYNNDVFHYEQSGSSLITIYAIDELGNQTQLGPFRIQIDMEALTLPVFDVTPVEDDDTPGVIHFDFSDDPNFLDGATLILPDGMEIPITGADISWSTDEPGDYTFTVVDNAGNRTSFTITVPGGGSSGSSGVMDNLEVTETLPIPTQQSAAPAEEQETAASSIPWLPYVACLSGFGLLLLILLLALTNVRIEYRVRRKDGTIKTVVRRKLVFARRKQVKVTVKPLAGAESIEVRLNEGLTRSVRGGNLQVRLEGSLLREVDIPSDTNGSFRSDFGVH